MTGPLRRSSPVRSSAIANGANRKRSLLRRGFGGAVPSFTPISNNSACDGSTPPIDSDRHHHHQQNFHHQGLHESSPHPARSIMTSTDNTAVSLEDGSSSSSSGCEVEGLDDIDEQREESIHVAVRFRPLNSKELSTPSSNTPSKATIGSSSVSPRRPSFTSALRPSSGSTNHHNHKLGQPQKSGSSSNSSAASTSTLEQHAWSLVAASGGANSAASGSRCSRLHHSVIQKGAVRKVEGRTVFSFDSVFGEQSSTLDVYHGLAKPLLEAVLRGQHATIFAYGQTGSGKTFTMHGDCSKSTTAVKSGATTPSAPITSSSSQSDGIIQMTLQDMFQQMQLYPEREFRVRVSFFEIYNEKVRDLLVEEPEDGSLCSTSYHSKMSSHNKTTTTRRLVQVRNGGDNNSSTGMVHVNCREQVLQNMEQARMVVAMGNRNRASAATHMNERSSRSHAIFRITVESFDKPSLAPSKSSSSSLLLQSSDKSPMMIANSTLSTSHDSTTLAVVGQVVRVAVLNLVDLSGSENARLTGNTGQRQREGGMINQSLLSLSQVIYSLSLPPKKRPAYINYRDSKLTRILQPHLSGNARIAILCCASPSVRFVEETRATLMFASRAKLVQTKPQVNEIVDDKVLLKRLVKELEEARIAIRQLQLERLQDDHHKKLDDAMQRGASDKQLRQAKLEECNVKGTNLHVKEQVKTGQTDAAEDESLFQKQEVFEKIISIAPIEPSSSIAIPDEHPTHTPLETLETAHGLSVPFTSDSPYTPRTLRYQLECKPGTLTHSSVPPDNKYNVEFRPDGALAIPFPDESAFKTLCSPVVVDADSKTANQYEDSPPELALTITTPRSNSKDVNSPQTTSLPFRLSGTDGDDDVHATSCDVSVQTGDGQRGSESDVAMGDNALPRASFIVDRSLGDMSRPRLRSPRGTNPPSEVVIMRESSFRGMPIPDIGQIEENADSKNCILPGTNHSNHSVDLRARLVDTEQRAQFLESKLEASDDLVEALFMELEGARKCIQKLVRRNVHLAALWREAENTLLLNKPGSSPTANNKGGPRSRDTSNDDECDDEDTPLHHNYSEDEYDYNDDATYNRTHQKHFKLLKYAIVLGLIFFLFGNTELFLAVAMFVGLTLEVNM